MLFAVTLLIAAVEVNEEPEPSLDRYATCVLRAALNKMPSRQIAELPGRSVTILVAEVATNNCTVERQEIVRSLPEETAKRIVRIADNLSAGLLIDGVVEIVAATDCPKRIKRDGVCF